LAVLLGCGCSDGKSGGSGGSGGTGGAGGTGGNGGSGGTGGDGNGPLLDPPPADQGLQFNLMPGVTVPPGQEAQVCVFFKLPSDTDFFFDRVQVEMSDGGRHFYLMKSEFFDFPDDYQTDCFAPVDTNTWNVVLNAQNKSMDWKVPDGVAFRLRRKTQLRMIVHFYNTGTEPLVGRATINLWRRDVAQVQSWVGVIAAVQNNISLAPGETKQVKLHCTLPIDTAEQAFKIHPTHILALNGDLHRTGTDFAVESFQLTSPSMGCPPTCDGIEGAPMFYDTTDGMNPLMKTFVPGSEPIIQNNWGFSFTCSYNNTTGQTVSFGPRVLTQEHCTLFIYFWPVVLL
jgi:hypothetical protein